MSVGLEPVTAKLICEKISCLWLPATNLKHGRTIASISRDHRITRDFAKLVIAGKAKDFSLSFLLNVAKKYSVSVEAIVGWTDSGGGMLHPDAWVIACVADQAIRRIASNIVFPSIPFVGPKAQAGNFSGYDKPKKKK